MQLRTKFTSLPIGELSALIGQGVVKPSEVAAEVIGAAESIRSSNCWLHFDAERLRAEADRLDWEIHTPERAGLLCGIPVSVKDLFDVEAQPVTCGSGFFRIPGAVAAADAPFVAQWRRLGALLAGKTHLNEFAYGITGENPWFGDCTIPGRPDCLTGGSSSGAAASVVGGAACIGLGTDTGGSLRVPAALCGLVSFRSRDWFPDHQGVFPLAGSFDTLGWMNRYLGDVGRIARALFPAVFEGSTPVSRVRLSFLEGPLLDDCELDVATASDGFRQQLTECGFEVGREPAAGWEAAFEIFAPTQAREAWGVHQARLEAAPQNYSPAVRSRLEWGRQITTEEHTSLQGKRGQLVRQMEQAFADGRLLILPATPFSRLRRAQDHSAARPRLLRLTTPASLGCWPVLTVPWRPGGEATGIGFQVMAPRGGEWRLVEFAERLASLQPRL
jgi:amidase/aspartyl-tRNA(Asn)/glutamyl-tRNA(Gln) amidotransferase subunit A